MVWVKETKNRNQSGRPPVGQPIIELTNSDREQLYEVMRGTDRPYMVRRALGILHLGECDTVAEVARRTKATRRSIYRWKAWYQRGGIEGLKTDGRGRPTTTVTPRLIETLKEILEQSPGDFGYIASRWTSSLLSDVVNREMDLEVAPSTLRRLLPRIGFRWRRARPTEAQRQDPNKAQKLRAINEAIHIEQPYTEVFFVDEASVDLNPRIGAEWCPVGQQPKIITPGQNEKRYVIGGLHTDTGTVTWETGRRCNSSFVVRFLERLHLRYRRARKIILIWDNDSTHHSQMTLGWLDEHPRFEVLYQPTYTPSSNGIEKLWKQLHDVVTRNHRHQTMDGLMAATERFLEAVEPFPGAKPVKALTAT